MSMLSQSPMTRAGIFALVALSLMLFTPTTHAGDIAAGEAKAATCVACHGAAGAEPIVPAYPILAGQHADYLLQTLKDYKNGVRNNAVMSAQVAGMTEADMADLAAYFAAQQGL